MLIDGSPAYAGTSVAPSTRHRRGRAGAAPSNASRTGR